MRQDSILTATLLLFLAGLGVAAPPIEEWVPPAGLPGEAKPTAQRIAEARKEIQEGKITDGIDHLQQVLETAGDDLAAVETGRAIQARRVCHTILGALTPAGLAAYRQRAEPQAKKWLEQARSERDARLLRRIVDEAFCTRAGGDALNLLGDMAFERGDFDEAESWWRMLLPADESRRGPPGSRLAYPDPGQTQARIEAKILLARIFRNADSGAAGAVQEYRARHGTAEGWLAGRQGRLADILAAAAAETRQVETSPWNTFAGDATRSRIIAAGPRWLDHLAELCREGPEWCFDLAERKKLETTPLPPGRPLQAARLAFHPLLVDGKAIVADARYVTAYDLRDGVAEVWAEFRPDGARQRNGRLLATELPAPPDLRYTLSMADGYVLARLGCQEIPHDPDQFRRAASCLICLRLRPAPYDERERWVVKAPEGVVFEGAPVARDGQVFVAATRVVGDRQVTALVCYPLEPGGQPVPRWQVDVCESRPAKHADRLRHHLVTLAGPAVAYCNHAGTVAAVDAQTGRRLWAVQYPSRALWGRGDDGWSQDLAPCVYARGKLYVAPADNDRLMCLDPSTGQSVWQRERTRVVHLIGVGEGRIIFSTATGLRALGADDGSDAGGWGPLPEDGSSMPPRGRGLLVGDVVLWPTAEGVFAVRQRDGLQPDNPTLLHQVPSGNLVFADDCLAVTNAETLAVFVPARSRLRARESGALLEPTGRNLLRLARAQTDAGQATRALDTLAGVVARTGLEGHQRERYRQLKQSILLGQLKEAIVRDDKTAGQWLAKAAGTEFTPAARLSALRRAAEWWQAAGCPERAEAIWQAVLDDRSLRAAPATSSLGLPCSGAVLAEHCLGKVSATGTTNASMRTESLPTRAVAPSAGLACAWQVQLADGPSELHACAEDGSAGLLLSGSCSELTCRQALDGKECWRARLAFTPCWASSDAGLVCVGGARGVACLRTETGGLVWELPLDADSHFSSFQLAAGRLFCLLDGRRLLAVDALRGWPLWERSAPGGPWLGARSRFHSSFAADTDRVLVQTASGRAWLLDAATGKLISSMPAPELPWGQAPVVLANQRWLLAEGTRRVSLREGTTGKEIWSHAIEGITTLTGAPPRFRAAGAALLLIVSTNLGYEIQALDMATGRPRWSRPLLFPELGIDPAGWALDAEALYVGKSGRLAAWSLADGRPLWESTLAGPQGNWHVRRVGGLLAALPAETAISRFQYRWLTGVLQWEMARPPVAGRGWYVPAVVCEARTGHVVQRFKLEAGAPRMSCRIGSASLTLLPTACKTVIWEADSALLCQAVGDGLVIAGAESCCGLRPTPGR